MGDRCEKHDEVMERIFNKMNDIELEVNSIKSSIHHVKEFTDKLHGIIFGNGKEGIVSKINRLGSQLNLQWGVLALIVVGVVTAAMNVMWKINQ